MQDENISQRELAERIDDLGILYDRLHALIADKTGAEPIIKIKLKRPHPKDRPIVRFATKDED